MLLKADYVQRNQSALKGKIGEKVASEVVTIYDDGLLEGGLRTWKFDGEGVPQQKTLIIERGVLRNFIYDNYTAKKEGRKALETLLGLDICQHQILRRQTSILQLEKITRRAYRRS
jgi:hypothetical protein